MQILRIVDTLFLVGASLLLGAHHNDRASQPPKGTATIPPIVARDAVPFEGGQNSTLDDLARSQYLGEASLVMEGFRRLHGAPAGTPDLPAAQWAPYFAMPTEGSQRDLNALLPMVTEMVALQAAVASSATAFDAAWEEAVTAASVESEPGTRQALAMAAMHKAELESQQARLVQLAQRAKAIGPLLDPVKEYRRVGAAHRAFARSVRQVVGSDLSVATGPGSYKLLTGKGPGLSRSGQPSGPGIKRVDPGAPFTGASHTIDGTTLTWHVPKEILPGQPAEFWMQAVPAADGGVRARIRVSIFNPLAPTNWLGYVVGVKAYGDRITHDDPEFREDRFAITFPDRAALLANLRNGYAVKWDLTAREKTKMEQLLGYSGDYGVVSAIPLVSYPVIDLRPGSPEIGLPTHIAVEVDAEWAAYRAQYIYEWSSDSIGASKSAPEVEEAATPSESQQQQRIAEIEANLVIIRQNMSRDQADLAKATESSQRASLEFRILQARSDLQAEEDLRTSLQTGQPVHTRSPFDDYAHDQFVEHIRTNQQAMEQFQRASDGLQRLAYMLPEGEADAARAFIARQVTPKDRSALNVAKLREIGNALNNKVQGYHQLQQARDDEAAARASMYMEMAQNIKDAADGGMQACSLLGGGGLSLAYSVGTGLAEGGGATALIQAAASLTTPTSLAFTAFQGYQEGGWSGATQSVAISYVSGKATTYALGKAMSQGSRPSGKAVTVKEAMGQAHFKQARENGIALAKDFQRTSDEAYRLSLQAKRGDAAAARRLSELEETLQGKAAAIHEDMHAKSFLKYKGDFLTQKAFNKSIGQVHSQVEAQFHQTMQKDMKWSPTKLQEFRNAASAGTVGMDFDIGLDPAQARSLSRGGTPATQFEWQSDAQTAWNKAYKQVTGRSAERSWETVTTGIHPEAYRDLNLLGQDKSKVSKLWAGQSADVTRYKMLHVSNDPHLREMEKLQEISRGTSKDMATKLLPLLQQTPSQSAASAQALTAAKQHWTKLNTVLEAFGKGDIDPVYATRRVRELTGGKSIREVVDESSTLMESLIKRSGR